MDDLQATAKWANRILRPLTSIYRRLEKHQETLAIIAAESKAEDGETDTAETHVLNEDESAPVQANYSGSDADEDDPVWIPGKKLDQRRLKHRYSNRGGRTSKRRTRISVHSPETNRTLPGAIELATPLITGKRWEEPPSAQSQGSAERSRTRNSRGQTQAFRDRYKLQKSPWQELLDLSGDTGFADIARNLDRVLQNFLCNTRICRQATTDAGTGPKHGARSLMSMVTRCLPEFIANEQEMQNEMEEDRDDNVCDAYFTELESFYAPHGRGWKPLREAVRAQGIHLVSSMIRNRWVTDSIAYALIEKCRLDEPDAFEALLSTFLSMCPSYPYPVAVKPPVESSVPGDPIRLLRKYASYGPLHRSFIFDELARLLQRGVLPPQWVSTKVWTSWMTRAIVSFSREDGDYAAASRLLEAVLMSSSDVLMTAGSAQATQLRQPRRDIGAGRRTRGLSTGKLDKSDFLSPCPIPVEDALSNHITSLLSALCGMHISRSRGLDEHKERNGTKAGQMINYVFYIVERDIEGKPFRLATAATSHQAFRRGCVIMADCLLHCNDALLRDDDEHMIPPAPNLEEICEYLSVRSDLVKELALFVQQAFRCFGGATENEHFGMGRDIRCMVSRLLHLGELPCLSELLRQVAVETAMQFAEGTGDPDDHLWAIEIQETAIVLSNEEKTSPGFTDDLPTPNVSRGYRWEESIGEWVARTPACKPDPAPRVIIRGRNSMTARSLPYVPCSTDSSSPESDHSAKITSSVTSSPTSTEPTSVGAKRNFAMMDSSPTRPAKRRRPEPVIVENPETSKAVSFSPRMVTSSSDLQREPSRRRILRDISTQKRGNQRPATRRADGKKVEVVIINQKETAAREERPQPVREPVEMQVHRTMERRRPRQRESAGAFGNKKIVREPTRPRTIIPYSEDSDDELSFL
ncbi:uncharacterized protein N7469_004201 [Penicillium citrinum]|uniref:Uncharacterized protein n=1 Tax=Penicillium citrinum TaxID=5077 RepID=A0A9W9P6Q2_PENCI|nr:uncharacterized protein N7469_004201 [Penicillium citrinum]KAJ5235033.1 hypothetical protein N7469_004201 [Penicillium citrinum]